MTENKRFTTQRIYKGFDGEKIYEWCVKDYDNILLRLTTRMDCKDVCEVLNSFHEENEQLKQKLKSIFELTKKIEDYTYDIKLIGDDVDD